MRRFLAVLVSTIAGLVVLLSFKTAPAKAPPSVALGSATPGTSSDPASSAPASSAPASSVPASSALASSPPVSSTPAVTAAATSSAAAAKPTVTPTVTPTKVSPKPTPKPSAKPSPKPSATPSGVTKTVTGSAVTVREGNRVFGVVQVQIRLTNGKITAVGELSVPDADFHSSAISSQYIPRLRQEVLAAQGSAIHALSGATYTSEGYAQSVQAALDAAKA
jgi:uncharacterized protein with FMN-binding domain